MPSFLPSLLSGLGIAIALAIPIAMFVGLYFLARIVRALDQIAAHYDRGFRS